MTGLQGGLRYGMLFRRLSCEGGRTSAQYGCEKGERAVEESKLKRAERSKGTRLTTKPDPIKLNFSHWEMEREKGEKRGRTGGNIKYPRGKEGAAIQ